MSKRPTYEYILAIDPGKKGAMCRLAVDRPWDVCFEFIPTKKAVYPQQLTKTGKVKKVKRKKSEPLVIYDLEKMRDVFNSLYVKKKTLVVIEEQHGRHTDSKHTVFEVGRSQAYLEMLAIVNKAPFIILPPTEWKPAYLTPGAEKSESIVEARKLYDVELPLAKDESKAEALLMADYVLNTKVKPA